MNSDRPSFDFGSRYVIMFLFVSVVFQFKALIVLQYVHTKNSVVFLLYCTISSSTPSALIVPNTLYHHSHYTTPHTHYTTSHREELLSGTHMGCPIKVQTAPGIKMLTQVRTYLLQFGRLWILFMWWVISVR